MSGLSLGTLLPNSKFVALTVFELLAFNSEKFRGSRDPGHAPFWKIFGVVSGLSLGRLVSNLKSVALTVFELLALTPIDRPLRVRAHTHTHTHTHTDRQTNIERTHYLRHSLRSLGGDNYCTLYSSVLQESLIIIITSALWLFPFFYLLFFFGSLQ